MNLIPHLAAWAREFDRPGVETTFTAGPPDRPKRSAWVTLHGPERSGQLTVWDTGEIELEAYIAATSAPVQRETAVVADAWQLDELLAALVAAVA